MAIKSKATQQATLQELAKGALGQRLQTDAGVLDDYLKFFDVETLRDASAPHRDRAERENEVFLDMLRLGPNTDGMPKPIVIFEDDDAIHLAKHSDCWVKNFEEFRNNEAFMLQYITHMEQHRLQQGEKEAKYPPGTSLQTAGMEAQARTVAQPTPQMIYQGTMQRQQNEQQQRQAAPAQQPGKPGLPNQAPRQPSGPGGGPGKIDTQAPAKNTPSAAMQGGM